MYLMPFRTSELIQNGSYYTVHFILYVMQLVLNFVAHKKSFKIEYFPYIYELKFYVNIHIHIFFSVHKHDIFFIVQIQPKRSPNIFQYLRCKVTFAKSRRKKVSTCKH